MTGYVILKEKVFMLNMTITIIYTYIYIGPLR
jgi:hypothetical protein